MKSHVQLPDGEIVFIPHRECMEASGSCFMEGRCQSNCRARERANRGKDAISTMYTVTLLLGLDRGAAGHQIVSALRALKEKAKRAEGGR